VLLTDVVYIVSAGRDERVSSTKEDFVTFFKVLEDLNTTANPPQRFKPHTSRRATASYNLLSAFWVGGIFRDP
jgi:hypothetical protein